MSENFAPPRGPLRQASEPGINLSSRLACLISFSFFLGVFGALPVLTQVGSRLTGAERGSVEVMLLYGAGAISGFFVGVVRGERGHVSSIVYGVLLSALLLSFILVRGNGPPSPLVLNLLATLPLAWAVGGVLGRLVWRGRRPIRPFSF